MEKTQTRNNGYDVIRIVSILLVVIIHANVEYLGKNQGSAGWYFVMLFTSVCLLAVPLFFMVSGALLLDTDKVVSFKDLFFKRILKQAIPFLVWSLVYIIIRIIMGKLDFSFSTFADILSQPAYYQFWFMYTLLAIYLLLPILQAVVIKLEKKQIEYILILWLIFSIALPVLQRYIPALAISEHVDLILCEGYIGYFFLGYYLKKYQTDVSWVNGLIFLLIGVIGTGVLCVIEWECTKGKGYQGYFYQAYLTPFVALATTGAFLLFSKIEIKNNAKLSQILKTGGALSLGIYYVHMLVMMGLEYIGLVGDTNLLLLALKIALTYGISLIIALIISKIPHIRFVLLGIGEKREN